jgi:hypothetical protein
VRVLGKCGGYLSDILDAMRWAAGLAVGGVPDNLNPAQVLNLSLGGSGACGVTEQDTIDEIIAAGAVIVVAAGNESTDAKNSSPGNCDGVVTVAANGRTGDRASYSNFGSVVEITAPGGTFGANGVLSTLDGGATTALLDDDYAFYSGTSMATPHVAGVVSLMLSIDPPPALTPAEVTMILQQSATAFPGGSTCTTAICGAGIVDAAAAVAMAAVANTAPVADAGADQNVVALDAVTLDGSASSDAESALGFAWSQVSGPAVALSGAATAAPAFTAPNRNATLVFQLTVADADDWIDQDRVTVRVDGPDAPQLDQIDDQTVTEGADLVFGIDATDADSGAPLLAADDLPDGASFDADTGEFRWIGAAPVGEYDVTFTATDADEPDLTDSETVTITVEADADDDPEPEPDNGGDSGDSGGSGGCSFTDRTGVPAGAPGSMLVLAGPLLWPWLRRALRPPARVAVTGAESRRPR